MNHQILQTMRELHSRYTDGIEVRLLWGEHDGRVAVTVEDNKTGESFAIEVLEGDRPMDVFHHPFAYAAWRGVQTQTAPALKPAAA